MRFARPPTWDRSGRQKVSSHRTAPLAENKHRNGPPVTTDHLSWPNERRKAAWLIPNSLRNPGPVMDKELPQGWRGFARRSGPRSSIEKRTRNFMPNRSPTLFCCFKNVRPQLPRRR
jgi:hypothetical protein